MFMAFVAIAVSVTVRDQLRSGGYAIDEGQRIDFDTGIPSLQSILSRGTHNPERFGF